MLTPVLLSLLLAQAPAATDTQAIRAKADTKAMPAAWLAHLDAPKAALPTPDDARAIFDALGLAVPDSYYIVHVVRWSKYNVAEGTPQTVDKQNWYVFRRTAHWTLEEFASNKRLYGTNKLGLLSIQLNCVACPTAVEYRIDAKKKNPANVVNLFEAVQLFVENKGQAVGDPLTPRNVYAVAPPVELWYTTSDISVTGKVWTKDGEEPGALNKEAVVFDNEGMHRWDVSFAVPIRSVKQLQFDAAGHTVSPSKPNRDSLLAVFDIYPWKTDIKRPRFNLVPYLVAGVSVSAKPLNRVLVGVGFGPAFAQFYVGAVLEKIQPAEGAEASGSWWKQRDKQLSFGINLPVRAVKDALKKQADEKKKKEEKEQ